MRLYLFGLFLTLVLAQTSFAGLCPSELENSTSAEMSEDYTAVIAVAVEQKLYRVDHEIVQATDYEIFDSLGSSLSGTLTVINWDYTPSFTNYTQFGLPEAILISEAQGHYTKEFCQDALVEVVADYQQNRRNYFVPPRNDCRPFIIDAIRSKSKISKQDCRFYSEYSSERVALLSKMSSVKEKIPEHYRSRKTFYTTSYPRKKKTNIIESQFEHSRNVSDISDELFVFKGIPILKTLNSDGYLDVTYAVLEDFGQFLPDTITIRAETDLHHYSYSGLISATRDKKPHLKLMDYEEQQFIIALADWITNGNDRSIDFEICGILCKDNEFDVRRVGSSFRGNNTKLEAEIAMQRLESLER